MSSSIKPFKCKFFKERYLDWWYSLTVQQKISAKRKFEFQRDANIKNKRNPYPNIRDISHLRLSQIPERDIYRIWVFKDYDNNLVKNN